MSETVPREGLYARLVEVLGDKHAMTLMRHLPPGDASDLATKQDIGRLEAGMERLEGRMDGLESRLDRLEGRLDQFGDWFHDLHAALRDQSNLFHAELRRQTRAFVLGLMGATAAVIASVIGVGLT